MADKPIQNNLPADLPENWTIGQIVAPSGSDVGLSQQHGYNYLMEMINRAQAAVNLINNAFLGLANIGPNGQLAPSQIPNIDCGIWDDTPEDPVMVHNVTPVTHEVMQVDGNNFEPTDTSTTLQEHITNPFAHQNLMVDGNQG